MKDLRDYSLLAHNTFGIDARCSRFLEYETAVEIILSKTFSSINGIGSALFESIAPYLEKTQVTYLKRVLKIRLKKEGNWMKDFETIVNIIITLYKRFSKK